MTGVMSTTMEQEENDGEDKSENIIKNKGNVPRSHNKSGREVNLRKEEISERVRNKMEREELGENPSKIAPSNRENPNEEENSELVRNMMEREEVDPSDLTPSKQDYCEEAKEEEKVIMGSRAKKPTEFQSLPFHQPLIFERGVGVSSYRRIEADATAKGKIKVIQDSKPIFNKKSTIGNEFTFNERKTFTVGKELEINFTKNKTSRILAYTPASNRTGYGTKFNRAALASLLQTSLLQYNLSAPDQSAPVTDGKKEILKSSSRLLLSDPAAARKISANC